MLNKEQTLHDLGFLINAHQKVIAEQDTIRACRNTIANEKEAINYKHRRKQMIILNWVCLPLLFFTFIGWKFFVILLIYIILFKKFKLKPFATKKYKNEMNELENTVVIPRLNQIKNSEQLIPRINNLILQSSEYQRIPNSYSHLNALVNLFIYLRDGRADNLKEAINLYETEQHRARMEQNQQVMISNTEQAAIDAYAARQNSEIAAAQSADAVNNSRKASAYASDNNDLLNNRKQPEYRRY